MIELKPCPACGGTRACVSEHIGSRVRLLCPDCYMTGPAATTDAAIAAWNALPRRPRWTNEPPTTTEELWFYRAPSSEPVIVRTFRPAPDLPLLAAYLDGHRRPSCDPGYTAVADMPGQWAGPITRPE